MIAASRSATAVAVVGREGWLRNSDLDKLTHEGWCCPAP
jgi:hypothetical protein